MNCPFHYHPCADISRALVVLQRHARSIELGEFFFARGTVVEQPAPYFCVFATKATSVLDIRLGGTPAILKLP